jgi:hypothetical protein
MTQTRRRGIENFQIFQRDSEIEKGDFRQIKGNVCSQQETPRILAAGK